MAGKVSKEYIQSILVREDNIGMHAVGRALVALHNRQTAFEKRSNNTVASNGIGFTPADAAMGSSHANYYLRNNFLTERQMKYWQRIERRGTARIAKYWRQLIEVAKEKQIAEQTVEKG